MDIKEIDNKLDKAINILDAIFASLPPSGFDEIEKIRSIMAEIQESSFTIFNDLDKEKISFSQLNHTKILLTQLSLLVLEARSLVEFLEYSYANYRNQFEKGEK